MRKSLLCCLALLVACGGPGSVDWQAWLTSEQALGRMRDDPAPPDAPFDNAVLARNFRTIAFDVERDPFATGRHRALPAPRMLRRWQGPVRWAVYAAPDERARVGALMRGFAGRLAGLTGLAFAEAAGGGHAAPANLQVWVVPDRIDALLEAFPPETPGGDEASRAIRARIADFIGTWYAATASPCAAQFFNVDAPATEAGTILGALVLIRAGLPAALLRSCVEEELTQTMGLPNDDASVRPSIFNDEKEFGVLTRHDELLLRVLYDPRLVPGMTPELAMPIVRQIIAELRPAG